MVSGDHFDPDSGALACGHGRDGFLARRVDDAGDAEKGEAGLDIGRGQGVLAAAGRSDGDGEEALSASRRLVRQLFPGSTVDRFIAMARPLG